MLSKSNNLIVLIVDDDKTIHDSLEINLSELEHEGQKVELIHAYTSEEGKNILSRNDRIAVIILDVMMESRKAGLDFVKFIRNDLQNNNVRILLHTGQPGVAPKRDVANEYEIDVYIDKNTADNEDTYAAVKIALAHYKDRLDLKGHAGSIAHEMRNPLDALGNIIKEVDEDMKDLTTENIEVIKERIMELTGTASNSIHRTNTIINITLAALKGKKIDPATFTILNASDIIKSSVKEHTYKSKAEKAKTHVNTEKDFKLRASEDLLIFALFNLLKNALYYFTKDPIKYQNSTVTVSTETNVRVNNREWNAIHVTDTGPGIAPETIAKLFGGNHTEGKAEGSGFGLSFCKRAMQAFNGDIFCESELGKWTKFTLLFPILSEQDLTLPSKAEKRKILIVDDELTSLLVEKVVIENDLHIICDTADSGKSAIGLVKENNKYELILMDFKMPGADGAEVVSDLRKQNINIPIIACTALDIGYKTAIDAGVNDLLIKGMEKTMLLKAVSKWMGIKYDPLENMRPEEIKSILLNKKILLADDQETNQMALSRNIERNGAKVDKASDGQELFNKFVLSIKNNDHYDLILSDINMPEMGGVEAAKKIREYESANKISPIPIIAYSGDGDIEVIHQLLNAGMNDYFVKGSKGDYLIRLIAFWVKARSK